MQENKLRVLSLFANIGVSECYIEQLGIDVKGCELVTNKSLQVK